MILFIHAFNSVLGTAVSIEHSRKQNKVIGFVELVFQVWEDRHQQVSKQVQHVLWGELYVLI